MNWKKALSPVRLKEPPKTSKPVVQNNRPKLDKRNNFESDFGRIIFSPALRRMHDKTQVFPLITDDNIHTRLPHSMEVQSVAQSIGMNLCTRTAFAKRVGIKEFDLIRTIPVILASISLCHDIGNPPFGHFGEEIIATFFKEYFIKNPKVSLLQKEKSDFEDFNGNAQGFRVLTKLQVLQDLYGLNLTAGTLSAYLKYPNLSDQLKKEQTGYKKKLGVFQSERELLNKIQLITDLKDQRNPLTFLMEAADNICYLTMDIEDGFTKGLYDLRFITHYLSKKGNENVKSSVKTFLQSIKNLNNTNKSTTEMVKLRIFIIQELVNYTIQSFLDNLSSIERGEYTKELILEEEKGMGNILQLFCLDNVYKNREIHSLEITGDSVLRGLLNHFVDDFINYKEKKSPYAKRAEKLYSLISSSIKTVVELETGKNKLYLMSDYYKLRMIVDYISGMTDNFALNLYQRLQGIKIA